MRTLLAILAVVVAPHVVTIDLAARRASGPIGARLGCKVHFALGMAAAICDARDALGVDAWCSTRDPDLIAAANASDRDRALTFTWDERDECMSIASH